MKKSRDGGERKGWGSWTGLPLLALFLAGGILASLWNREVRSGAFLIGDCPYYASAAVSMAIDGDLDLRNQLRGGLPVHQRQIALGRGGQWYPKHPILMPLLTVPFYATLGIPGFLIFNLAVLVILGLVIWRLCRRHVSPGLATIATATVLGGSFLRGYSYNYSPDLFSALLVLAGLLLVLQRRGLGGGLFLGLSVLGKITNLGTVLVVLAFQIARRPRRDLVRTAAGVLPGIVAVALINVGLFGSPTISGYDRTLILEDGREATVSHRGFFDRPAWEGIRGQLLAPRVGLLTTSPVLLLALPGFFLLLRRSVWEGLLILGLSEFVFLLFSTYRWWATSHYGNRFLMVPVCLAAVPLALTLQWVRSARLRAPLPDILPVAGTRDK